MWSVSVVVLLPSDDVCLRLGEGCEQGLVQKLVSETADEALDKSILRRLAWRDVVPADAGILASSQDGHTGQFSSVVAHDGLGTPSELHDRRQLTCDAKPG